MLLPEEPYGILMPVISRELDRIGVQAGGVEAIAVVAAAIENGKRNATLSHEIQYQPVASDQMGVA
jgi:hypothetical protein